jgi:uridine kinase
LLEFKETDLPVYDFAKGRKFFGKLNTTIDNNNIIIIEGIHALNPELITDINTDSIFKIYVSALTQVAIDDHNRIPSTDNRLLRRMIRDHKYRSYKAVDTIKRWPSVRHGEEKYIFPFQENADVMFNSALIYELGVLKVYAEPLLQEIKQNAPEYAEAKRLLKFLSYFLPISDKEINGTSLLREFIGSSSFKY